ncbi:hypothetical protein [Burkholderia sp. Ac-20365]|jgi:hypothetical protein|uniref:hypothetical protein n=1 Tax=Burkholderia sp. Ac-20365 TaxID=2703897 RepID=UPI00197BDC83|nr:hypothetical protein [Burkholderia sp. Ac-20365]
MYCLLLSTLPQTREARAHYDAFLSLKYERRERFATFANTLHSIAARLRQRLAA